MPRCKHHKSWKASRMAQSNHHHAVVLSLGMMLGSWYGQPAIADDVLSPLVVTAIAPPNPVLGADNKTHLAYEIVLMNMGSTTVGIEKIETLDATSGAVLNELG